MREYADAMGRPTSLTAEQRDRVSRALRDFRERLRTERGSVTQQELARELVYPDGEQVGQQTVSNVLAAKPGTPVGVAFAAALARRLGMSFEELVDGVPAPVFSRAYSGLPGWKDAAQTVVASGLAPDYAVLAAGQGQVAYPVEAVTPALVYDLAMLWLRHAPLEVRTVAETSRVDEEMRRARRG